MINQNKLIIKGAKEHNLKNINLEIPKNNFVVITGVSGSGKSSLAFNTIYAEGQRRYLESLSSYARQFLGNNQKPKVDKIIGMSPTIAIDQKSTGVNPRSTVGTITEVYDYLRLLFSKIGTPYCINNHGIIKTQTIKQIVDNICSFNDGSKLYVCSPLVKQEKGTFFDLFNKLRKEGFQRVRVDGYIYDLDEEIVLEKNNKHTIDLVVDRLILHHDELSRSRIFNSVELALQKSNGKVLILDQDEIEYFFNIALCCDKCSFSIPEIEPRLFSFNSPIGACNTCKGLGFVFRPDEQKMIPNPELSIEQGAIDFFKNTINTSNFDWQKFNTLLNHYNIPKDVPINSLTRKQLDYIFYGSDEPISYSLISSGNKKYEATSYIEGVIQLIERRHQETNSEMAREYYSKYMSEIVCKECNGDRLNTIALCIKIKDKNIIDLCKLDINELLNWLLEIELTDEQKIISELVLKEIIDRLSFLINVGLEYLTLNRMANTLSGGESQRIRLASQLGSNLTGVIYVLDEPSIGLHQKDNDKLIQTLKEIKDLGNTLIVVEHDIDTINAADYIVEIGPSAGINGGYIIASGTVDQIKENSESLIGQYLSYKKTIEPLDKKRPKANNKLILKGARGNNLKNIDLTIPLNKLIAVTGVSGSGKSTLILQTLAKAINKQNFNPFEKPLPYKELIGSHHIDKLIIVSQDPIGRTPRSNPATYVGVFDEIRDVFANLKEAKEKGFTKSRFSFNVKGGRCEYCQGDGIIKIDMHFLPSVYVKCSDCDGKKYNEETLSIRFKSKSIYDVLKMNISEAKDFFKSFPSIYKKLSLLEEVGLGYLELGSNSTDLSGGEAQRIKLAKYLQKKATGKTLYILDEPTTGLHIHDVNNLIKILNRIVNNGDTVIVIEHNLELINECDWIIDIGPEGGKKGGQIVYNGPTNQIYNQTNSYTAKYLNKLINKE